MIQLRKLLLSLVLLFGMQAVMSQDFGMSGGLNLANGTLSSTEFSIAKSVNVQSRASFYIGAYFEFKLEIDDLYAEHVAHIRNRFFLQIGLRYQENGFELKNSSFLEHELSTKIGQLNMPIFLKYIIWDNLAVKFGGYGAFYFSVDQTYNNITYDAKEQNENFGGGLLLGVEYELLDHIILEARYHFESTRMTLNSTYIGASKFKNEFAQFGVGFRF